MECIKYFLSGEASMQALKFLNQKRSRTVRRFILGVVLLAGAPSLMESAIKLIDALK